MDTNFVSKFDAGCYDEDFEKDSVELHGMDWEDYLRWLAETEPMPELLPESESIVAARTQEILDEQTEQLCDFFGCKKVPSTNVRHCVECGRSLDNVPEGWKESNVCSGKCWASLYGED